MAKRVTFGLLTSTMICGSGAAYAQTTPAPAANPDDQEVIVTAQKRSENLQNVPISIQALGTVQLQEQNVSNFQDYTRLLPSISYQTLQPGTTNVYIRGVASGGDGNHSGSLPSVGVYLDEQPVTTIGGTLDVHIYDIARIEVLRGPQGTLYGASSEAGTIRIISNRPETSGFSGAIDGELNSVRHGSIGGSLEGYVNAPLSDAAAIRLVAWYQHDAGYIDNIPGTRSFRPQPGGITVNNNGLVENNYNDVDTVGGRAALGIDLSEHWTVTAALLGQDQRSHGSFAYDPRLGDLNVQHFYPERNHDRFWQAALTVEGRIGNFDITYAGAYMDRRRHTTSDYTDYAEAYDNLYAGVGGLAGYFYFQDNNGNTINPSQHIVGRDHYRKMSHELRIASPAENRLRFVGGLFFQRQEHRIHQDYQVTGLASALSVNGFPGTLWLTQQDRVDRDYAAFGELSFDIVPTVTLTGGIRAYRYDNSLIGFFGFGRNPNGPPFNGAGSSRTGVAGCYTTTGQILRDNPGGTLIPGVVPGTPCTDLGTFVSSTQVDPKSTDGNGITYRANLTWHITDRQMVYATWSSGFRPGGINRRATIPPYAKDTLTNYEIGFHTTWPGGFRLNGAAYWQEWRNFQYSFLGANSFTEIHNGPDARIRGAELELNWRATPQFTLAASAAYTNAKTRRNLCLFDDPTFTCAPTAQVPFNVVSAPAGTRLPVTPRFKFNASARYEFPLARGTGHVQAIVSHQSSATSDLRRLIFQPGTGNPIDPAVATGPLNGSTTADFSFGLEWTRFTAELFVENAFDERAQLTRGQQCGQCFQRPYIVTNTPRTIGIRVGTRF